MPLFEFVCETCKTSREILVRGDEKPVCPECGSSRMRKQASAFAPLSSSEGASTPCSAASSCCQRAEGACPYQR
jgi:putative FmdB family regulatory protein